MRRTKPNSSKNPLMGSRNWEENILNVVVEPCESEEDPLGYKAVFFLTLEAANKTRRRSFEIGASFLAQRYHNLSKAGYSAPMTIKAIEAIEAKIGDTLPMFLGIAGKSGSIGAYA